MGAGESVTGLDPAEVMREFARVRRGYDPAAVDRHLATLARRVAELVERGTAPDESLDLVLQATRRSVEEALQDARARAEAVVAEAEEVAASRIAEAEAAADVVTTHAAEKVFALDAEGRERYAEMVRLTDARTESLARLDAEIADRRQALRTAAVELERLAETLGEPAATDTHTVAALGDSNIEIVLSAEPGSID